MDVSILWHLRKKIRQQGPVACALPELQINVILLFIILPERDPIFETVR